jgi:hypothetical protein
MRMRRISIGTIVVVLLLAGCGWTQRDFDGGHSNANPFETTITPANVGALEDHVLGPGATYVVDGWVVLNTGFGAVAYDRHACPRADGGACTPIWFRPGRYLTGSDGTSMVFTDTFTGTRRVEVTDLALNVRWSTTLVAGPAPWAFVLSDPTIANGVVLFWGWSDFGGLYPEHGTLWAFRLAGCGAATCAPLWSRTVEAVSANGEGMRLIAAADGRVITNDDGGIPVVRDLEDGHALWHLSTPIYGQARIAGNQMIAPRLGSDPSVTGVYSADGTTGCSGVPKVCSPVRSIAGYGNAVSAGDDVVEINYGLGWSRADGSECTGSPCTPAVSTTPIRCPNGPHSTCFPVFAQPVIAGDVVYAVGETSDGAGHLHAFDLTGHHGCSGHPVVCSPLLDRTMSRGGAVQVWDGRVYVQEADGYAHVLGLPGTFS